MTRLGGFLAAVLFLPGVALAGPIVLAAASTSGALDAAISASGIPAVASYGASGTLARQIEQGAPAGIFLSANPKWMDYLVEAGLVEAGSVSVLMSNRLVLIAPEGAEPLGVEEIANRLDDESFVMADPASAPVGAYGKEALEALGVWGEIAPHFVPVRNTLASVASVAAGEAALGLVYASDAAGVDGITVVLEIPEESHPPIRYLVAPVRQGEDAEGAAKLLSFLLGDGGEVLASHGFLPVRKEM